MEVVIELDQASPKDRLKEATLNLIAHAPREEVSYISLVNEPVVIADMSAQSPYLRALCFLGTPLHFAFPEPAPGMDGEIFPSLQHITLDRIFAPNDDWSRLITFRPVAHPLETKLSHWIPIFSFRIQVHGKISGDRSECLGWTALASLELMVAWIYHKYRTFFEPHFTCLTNTLLWCPNKIGASRTAMNLCLFIPTSFSTTTLRRKVVNEMSDRQAINRS